MENKLTDTVVGTTCFAEHEKMGVQCQKKSCRQWMNSSCHMNCAIIAASQNDEGMTLQQIGDIFSITRMRVCQLEKASLQKISVE
jgi:DNA-directed RNA polymerase sigma subunit (sigma70/sigma32)